MQSDDARERNVLGRALLEYLGAQGTYVLTRDEGGSTLRMTDLALLDTLVAGEGTIPVYPNEGTTGEALS